MRARCVFERLGGNARRALWSASLQSRNQAMREVMSAAGACKHACMHAAAGQYAALMQGTDDRSYYYSTSSNVRGPCSPSSA